MTKVLLTDICLIYCVDAVNVLEITQDRRAMALLAPQICSPAASRPAAILKTLKTQSWRSHRPYARLQTPAHGAAKGAAATAEPAWQVYTGKMPLVGFEKVAAVLKYVQPAQQLLQLHTYTLLQGPDQVTYRSATHHLACCKSVPP
jgi:hypothetical protein